MSTGILITTVSAILLVLLVIIITCCFVCIKRLVTKQCATVMNTILARLVQASILSGGQSDICLQIVCGSIRGLCVGGIAVDDRLN